MHKYPQFIHKLPHKSTFYPQALQKTCLFPQASFAKLCFAQLFFIFDIKKSACSFYASGFYFQKSFLCRFFCSTSKTQDLTQKFTQFFIKFSIPKKLNLAGQLQESTYIQNSGIVRFLSPLGVLNKQDN